MHIDLGQLEALAHIVDCQSFERAAERLCITQSAISQRLRQLEQSLGQRLLVRSTPPVLTEAGQRAMKYYRQVSHLQQDFMADLSGLDASGRQSIAIGVNADSLATWLLDALAPILAQQNLFVEIKVDDQDRTHELLRSGEVIGCITASDRPVQGCHCVELGVMTYRSLISPAYRTQYFPHGVDAQSMLQAPCVEFNHKDDLQRQYLQRYFNLPYPEYWHRVPSTESFLEFIARGYAWGMVPDVQSWQQRQRGEVEELVPGWTLDIPLNWHIWRMNTRLARQLTEALQRAAEKALMTL